jgi:hypothetical protein
LPQPKSKPRNPRIETPGCFGSYAAVLRFFERLLVEVTEGRRTRQWYDNRVRNTEKVWAHESYYHSYRGADTTESRACR